MKIKNKFLIVILFILILVNFCLSTISSANYDIVSVQGNLQSIPDLPDGNAPFGFIYYELNASWLVAMATFVPNSYFKISEFNKENNLYKIICCDSLGNQINFKVYGKRPLDTFWMDNLTVSSNGFTVSQYNNSKFSVFGKIYNSDGTIFFPVPPVTLGRIMGTTFKTADIMGTMKTMIAGFLKYLIVLVISVIAFWKGWQFLLRHFNTA